MFEESELWADVVLKQSSTYLNLYLVNGVTFLKNSDTKECMGKSENMRQKDGWNL